LAATRRSVYINQVNRVNSRDDFGHDDSAINIVVAIIIIPGDYICKHDVNRKTGSASPIVTPPEDDLATAMVSMQT